MSYHMRKQDREITDQSELEDIVKVGRFAVLGLCRDNEPYVVSLSYGYDEGSCTLYFHAAKEGLKIDFLKKNPRVCLTIIDDHGSTEDECGHAYRSVVIRGEMKFVDDEAEKEKSVETLICHFEKDSVRMMSRVKSGSQSWRNTQMLKLTIAEITGKKRSVVHRPPTGAL